MNYGFDEKEPLYYFDTTCAAQRRSNRTDELQCELLRFVEGDETAPEEDYHSCQDVNSENPVTIWMGGQKSCSQGLPSPVQTEILPSATAPATVSIFPTSQASEDEQPTQGSLLPSTESFLFLTCGLGSSLCYVATLSSLVYFKELYGSKFFVYLNLVIYLPLLPISLAQAHWDPYYDASYPPSQQVFLIRGGVGFGLNLMGTIGMMLSIASRSFWYLLFMAMLQGTGGAILYGTLNQLASFVSIDGEEHGVVNTSGMGMDHHYDTTKCYKAAVSAGVQFSALVVLLASYATGFGDGSSSFHFSRFLGTVASIEGICWIAFMSLIMGRPTVVASLLQRDSALLLRRNSNVDGNGTSGELRSPLLASESDIAAIDDEYPFLELFRRTRSCCIILLITLIPSFLVASWFTRVPAYFWKVALPSWLFYIRIGSDFAGRLVTFVQPPRMIARLTNLALIRWVFVGLFLAHSLKQQSASIEVSSTGEWNDILLDLYCMGLVAIIAFLSGYLVTGCYQLAPLEFSYSEQQPGNLQAEKLTKQTSLLTVVFAISAVTGVLSSLAFTALDV